MTKTLNQKMTKQERLAYMKSLITMTVQDDTSHEVERAELLLIEQQEQLQSVKQDVLKGLK